MTKPSDAPIEVVVTDRREVADRVLEFTLEPVTGDAWPPYDAGAHVDVFLPTGDIRQYSLLGPPGTLRFAVLRTDDSRGGSRHLHERVRPGHRFRVSPPKSHFALDEDAEHSVLIAGGIGITPLLAMARRLATLNRGFELHYRARSRERAAFLDELDHLVPAGGLHVVVDTDPAAAHFSPETIIATAGLRSTVYVCGPEPFMNFVKNGATKTGLPAEHVHEEHFRHNVQVGGPPFTIEARRSGVTVTVGPDDTAATALTDAGAFVPTACGQGVCGTCLVPVLSGVPDHRDIYLSSLQKRRGDRMTLCCSRAETDSLVVDI